MPKTREQPPAVLVEWQAATQEYVDAREADEPIGPALARVRKAWLAIKNEPRVQTQSGRARIDDGNNATASIAAFAPACRRKTIGREDGTRWP